MIDHGTIIAEGTADELKERPERTYCEIGPAPPDGSACHGCRRSDPLLPEQHRAALTTASDRIAMPAPDGPNTLAEALYRLNTANIELARHRVAATVARRGVPALTTRTPRRRLCRRTPSGRHRLDSRSTRARR